MNEDDDVLIPETVRIVSGAPPAILTLGEFKRWREAEDQRLLAKVQDLITAMVQGANAPKH